jgi:hypothetical protein
MKSERYEEDCEMKQEHKACYGMMFHETLHIGTNQPMKGKVFSFEVDSQGLGVSDRLVKTDITEWDDCLKCPEFEHCYKFCMARLALETAVSAE